MTKSQLLPELLSSSQGDEVGGFQAESQVKVNFEMEPKLKVKLM